MVNETWMVAMDILLIEDHQEIANLIKAFLQKEGFSLWHETNGEDALHWLKSYTPQIVLLDIMLPGMDGFTFCQMVRQQCNVPIIILSAKSTKDDQLMGFELGADDYMEKPVDPDILNAKIHALLTRAYGRHNQNILESKDIIIDRSARKVTLKGNVLELNVKEYELLLCLVKNPGKTLHKDYLFNQIWGMHSESESQTLTVHIKMLRSKIEDVPKQPKRIITVWGIGYRYEEI